MGRDYELLELISAELLPRTRVGFADHDRSRSIVKRSTPRSIRGVCAPIDRRLIVDRSRSTISKRERDRISVARRRGGRRTSPPSLSSSLPLTRRNFRHEDRREENFSFFVSVSLSLARPCARDPSRDGNYFRRERSSPLPSPSRVLLSPSSPFSLSLIFSSLDQRSESEEFSFHQRIQLSGQPRRDL